MMMEEQRGEGHSSQGVRLPECKSFLIIRVFLIREDKKAHSSEMLKRKQGRDLAANYRTKEKEESEVKPRV